MAGYWPILLSRRTAKATEVARVGSFHVHTLLSCMMFMSSTLLLLTIAAGAQPLSSHSRDSAAVNQSENINVDVREVGSPFPHFWEQMFGAGQSILALRESYRTDLRIVKAVTDFHYVRFHDILGDQVGLYGLGKDGKPYYNYSYVDQIYDGLLADGVRPFVELSFMPSQLAATDKPASVWYKPNTSPPKDYVLWDDMVSHFVRHLVDRYGIDEVSQWYFEVWNEPDYAFPTGFPKQETYFKLYDHTAIDVKGVDPRLRVGGPATANATWITAFLNHCNESHVPVSFVSTHMYGDESAEIVFNTKENIPRNRMISMAVAKVHGEIKASAFPQLPFILSEFNASWMNEPEVTDSVYMGPWLADTIRQCDGMVDLMSYWTFSDVFEEEGVVKKPFYGGFGLVAVDNIPKPAFNAFLLLHRLGDTRLHSDSESALVTRLKDRTLVIALWNYGEPETNQSKAGTAKTFELRLNGVSTHAAVYVSRLDASHGNVLQAFDAMGQPSWPTKTQIDNLRTAAKLLPAEVLKLRKGHLQVSVPTRGLVLLEIR
jgi:xylan 1,4-beta-xylosidase